MPQQGPVCELQRFRITASREQRRCAQRVIIISERIDRREPPRFLCRADRRVRLVAERVQRAAHEPGKRFIRIAAERRIVPLAGDVHPAQQIVMDEAIDGQSEGVLRIDVQRASRAIDRDPCVLFPIRAPAVEHAQNVPLAEPGVNFGRVRRAPPRFLDQIARPGEIAQRRPVHETDPGEQQPVVLQIGKVSAGHVLDGVVRDRASDGDDDLANTFRRSVEKSFGRSSELPRPQDASRSGIDEVGVQHEFIAADPQRTRHAIVDRQTRPNGGNIDRVMIEGAAGPMRDYGNQIRSRERARRFLGEPVAQNRLVGCAADRAERQHRDGRKHRPGRRLRRQAVERVDLLRIHPQRAKPAIEAVLADMDPFEQFAGTRPSDKGNPGEVEREVGIRAGQNFAETVAHDLLDIGQGAPEALPPGVVTRCPPKRLLQEGPRAASERRRREKCKERPVLGARDLKSAGLRGSDHAGSKQANLNALGLHQNIPNGETVATWQ